jgi:orotate phosphoribosyltransferase
MERGQGELSAVQEVEKTFGLPVISIANLDDLMAFLQADPETAHHIPAMQRYRERYGTRVRDGE